MPNTAELTEQRANVWSQMTEIMEIADKAKRDLTAEESAKYDAAEADLDALEASIARQTKHEARSKSSRVVNRDELKREVESEDDPTKPEASAAYRSAFCQWMSQGAADMDRDQRDILRAGQADSKDIKAAAGVATGAAGGYTVPLEYRAKIIERMKQVSSVRAVSDHITTDSGVNLPWPTVDDTGNMGAILSENTQVTEQDFTFGTNSLDAYMYTSKLVRVSLQLLQDSFFDYEAWLARALGTRIARIQNQHFSTGTGVSQPDGIVTNAPVGKVGAAGQTSTITYEDLVDMTDSLDPAYLGGGDLQWMMSQLLRKSIRKIKDNQSRPLWQPSIQAGIPDSLLGYGTVLNNDMPAPGPGAKSLLFGDYLEAYIVRDVKDLFIVRFAERYMDFLQVGFAGFCRTDATVQNSAAYSAYQHPAS